MPNENPTDEWARDLLHRAADTIDVGPAGPVETAQPRRLWPLLVAAAAVIAVAVTTAVVVSYGEQQPPPADKTPAPVVERVPSVFGYDAAGARAMLEESGLVVTEKPMTSCEPEGRAVETVPAAGSPIGPGDDVSLRVAADNELIDCIWSVEPRREAWEFLDFANGRGPAPQFADRLTLYVDGGDPVVLTSPEAADPSAWGELVQAIRADTAWVTPADPEIPDVGDPTLSLNSGVRPAGPTMGCEYATPVDLVGRDALVLSFSWNTQAFYVGCHVTVELFRSKGVIDTVVASTKSAETRMAEVPSVVGLSSSQATRTLKESGFGVTTERADRPGCDAPGTVLSQSPEAGTAVEFGATVRLDVNATDDPDCTVDPDLVATAQSFIDFARGDLAQPPVAGSVDFYVGNVLAGTIPEGAAGERARWKGCPPGGQYAAASCPVSALDPILSLDVNGYTPQFTAADPGGICMVLAGNLPTSLTASYSFVTIVPESSFATCASNFAIQLFVDTDDRIVAVNLVGSEP